MKRFFNIHILLTVFLLIFCGAAFGLSEAYKGNIYNPGILKPIDSILKVKVGDPAPDFILPSISGGKISLGQFAGKKNVVISFVPAAWTPVCSDQWPGYNIAKGFFDKNNAVLLGITVDNIPTLHAWTQQMGKLWFSVLGPMVMWLPVTVFSVPTVSRKEPFLSLIKQASYSSSM